jgi:hypothetical protein
MPPGFDSRTVQPVASNLCVYVIPERSVDTIKNTGPMFDTAAFPVNVVEALLMSEDDILVDPGV